MAKLLDQPDQFVKRIAIALSAAVVVGGLALAWRDGGGVFSTPDQRGQRLFDDGEFGAAAEEFDDPYWQGVAWYRAGEFEKAAAVFGGLPGPDAAFNQGNALVMRGKYEEAVKRYDRALELHERWPDAENNRAIAVARGERMKQEGGDMTGGMLGADDIVFDGAKSNGGGEEETVEGAPLSDEEVRTMWLRQVQTTPGDFLKAKFAYQQAHRQEADANDE